MAHQAPVKLITQNTQDNLGGSDQRSSGWLIGIVRYLEPSSLADSTSFPVKVEVIQNDAVSVNVTNAKSSFGKMCNISLKSTDFWYPSMVSPGDWIFVWMHDNQQDIDRITHALNRVRDGGAVGDTLCNENSGLKFAGRCLGVSHSDSVASSGQRSVNQTISAQSFIEFATSVYYTAKIQAFNVDALAGAPGTGVTSAGVKQAALGVVENIQFGGLDSVLHDIAIKYRDFYAKGTGEFTPDVIISLFFILIMGIDKDKYTQRLGANGIFNNGIHVPKPVGLIFNRPKATKIWQLMTILLGLQDYKTSSKNWFENFSPVIDEVDGDVFQRTPIRLKGLVPFAPALWDNVSMWNILSNYLNPVCNEMYTALRINRSGAIVPSLIIREKPFSTGLFDKLKDASLGPGGKVENTKIASEEVKPDAFDPNLNQSKEVASDSIASALSKASEMLGGGKVRISTDFAKAIRKTNEARTLYGKLPRWQISESVVRSFNFSTNESNRINFVQVWGRSAGAEFVGAKINQSLYMMQQFNNGNFYVDELDIQRNGLRAYIVTSPYDVAFGGQLQFFAKTWAKMNADWLFNGQLKLNASLTINGVTAPICEGDNLEFRGLLFHIDSVAHTGSLDSSGRKIWTTQLSLSNGLLARSLDNPNSMPAYAAHQRPQNRKQLPWPLVPGHTEAQTRLGDSSKNNLGDSLNSLKDKGLSILKGGF